MQTMTQRTAGPAPPDDQSHTATFRRYLRALESVEELLEAHRDGLLVGDLEVLGIRRVLREVGQELHAQQLAAEPGSEEAALINEMQSALARLHRHLDEAGLLAQGETTAGS
jgi:hypothetical protein